MCLTFRALFKAPATQNLRSEAAIKPSHSLVHSSFILFTALITARNYGNQVQVGWCPSSSPPPSQTPGVGSFASSAPSQAPGCCIETVEACGAFLRKCQWGPLFITRVFVKKYLSQGQRTAHLTSLKIQEPVRWVNAHLHSNLKSRTLKDRKFCICLTERCGWPR